MTLTYQLIHAIKFVLGMRNKCEIVKFEPKVFNFQQKRQIELVQESLNDVNNDAELLKWVMTGSEKHGCYP